MKGRKLELQKKKRNCRKLESNKKKIGYFIV